MSWLPVIPLFLWRLLASALREPNAQEADSLSSEASMRLWLR